MAGGGGGGGREGGRRRGAAGFSNTSNRTNSFAIVDSETGRAVREVSNTPKNRKAITFLKDRFKAVPMQSYLKSLSQ